MAKSRPAKTSKPYPDFPLTPHPSGRWCKKIKGRIVYFGPIADPDAALAKYLDQRDDLQAGRKPRQATGGATVRDLVNRFLTMKRQLVDNHELSPRTFAGYHATCLRVAEAFGPTRAVADLRPEDFETLRATLSRGRGPVALGNEVRHVGILFRYADAAAIVDSQVRLGPTFREPSKRVLRQARNAAGSRMLEADELRRVLAAATQPLQSMILLGINGGFGNSDVATLPRSAVDLSAGVIDFPRPKTAVARRVPLWPETFAALAEALPRRPAAKDAADDGLAFLTRFGKPWVRMERRKTIEAGKPEWTPVDSVGLMFARLLTDLGLKRPRLSFYCLRHGFETIAGESRDQVAVNAVMGHDPGDMASHYRERIGDDRLRAVVEHVRGWLFEAAG